MGEKETEYETLICCILLFEGVMFVVGLKDLSDISPRPHHYLVHTTRMFRHKGTNIIHLQMDRERERERERESE